MLVLHHPTIILLVAIFKQTRKNVSAHCSSEEKRGAVAGDGSTWVVVTELRRTEVCLGKGRRL